MITPADRLAAHELALLMEDRRLDEARRIEAFLAGRMREGHLSNAYPRRSACCVLCGRDLNIEGRSENEPNICRNHP